MRKAATTKIDIESDESEQEGNEENDISLLSSVPTSEVDEQELAFANGVPEAADAPRHQRRLLSLPARRSSGTDSYDIRRPDVALLRDKRHPPPRPGVDLKQMSFNDFLRRSCSDSTTLPNHQRPALPKAKLPKPPRVRRRLVYKNGQVNISPANVAKRKRRYLADIFTTMIDLKWRYLLSFFFITFTLTWLLFGAAYLWISFLRSDMVEANVNNRAHKPCITYVTNFTTALLFSIETQQTIGFGFRHVTDRCAEVIVGVMIQSCVGALIHALMTGIVFAKLSRPKRRGETVLLSKSAVIAMNDGQLCWMIRVGDMRRSHLIETRASAVMVKKKITKEGEILPLHQHHLALRAENGCETFLLTWPILLVHEIDQNSPFWNMGRTQLLSEKFEIIVILEGIVEATGMTAQIKTSYLPEEILWGHRFKRLVSYEKTDGVYKIDYRAFDDTMRLKMSSASARTQAKTRSASPSPSPRQARPTRQVRDAVAALADATSSNPSDSDSDAAGAKGAPSAGGAPDPAGLPRITIDYASDTQDNGAVVVRSKRSHSLKSAQSAQQLVVAASTKSRHSFSVDPQRLKEWRQTKTCGGVTPRGSQTLLI